MSNMSDENFKNAVTEALLSEYVDMLPESTDEHIFSRKFEKKMYKLIKQRNKVYYPFINSGFKRTAIAIGTLIIVSTVSVTQVDALRKVFTNIRLDIFEKYSVITPSEDSQVPEKIEEIYEITYDLSGYEVVYEKLDDTSNFIEYVKNDVSIDFTQYVKGTVVHLNTENADIQTIMINEIEAIYFIDYKNYQYLTWENEEYFFVLISNVEKDMFFDIAKSVEKVK